MSNLSAVQAVGTPLGLAPGRERANAGIADQMFSATAVLVLLLMPILISPFAGFFTLLLCAGAAFATAMLFTVASVRIGNQHDLSGFLVVPLVISAFQNVYLGILAPYMAGFFVQLALLTHIVFGAHLMAGYFFARPQGAVHPLLSQMLVVALVILLFAVISVVAMRTSAIPMVSSARNMLSPFLFLMLGLLLAERVRLATFLALVSILAWATLLFGMLEYFGSRTVWSLLNIEILWAKKGIPNLASWGMPANFVSSELVFGQHVRRMVSSYADPVNFGTVLFLFFMVAWFTRRWWLLAACLLAIGLAMSKGALLGLLVFAVAFAWHSGNRVLFGFAAFTALVLGAGVVGYTLTHSTQSLATHVGGLAEALRTLPAHPFGRGLGGAGVLTEGTGALRESGLGLIIGQMGVLAFLLFGVFFWGIWRWLLPIADPRERLLAQVLFLGLFGNIAFNEVALSPNSSGGFFILLGLLIAGDWLRRRRHVDQSVE